MNIYRDLDDNRLLELLKSSDHCAFEEIYKRYWPILFRHAQHMSSSNEEAKDLIQDLFINLWQKAEELNISGSLSSYLYGTVRYKVFDLIDKRKVKNRHLESLGNFMDTGIFSTDNTVRENELARLIEKEISMLPLKMREVFELSRKSHLNYQQISERLHISDETVKKQVYNALKILKVRLAGVTATLIFFI